MSSRTFKYTLKKAQARYYYEKVLNEGAGTQGSYNFPIDLREILSKANLIRHMDTSQHGNNIHKNYLLDSQCTLILGRNLLNLIGNEYINRKNKLIFVHTRQLSDSGSGKFQLIKTTFSGTDQEKFLLKHNEDLSEYEWFVHLYDKCAKDDEIVLTVDDEKKEIKVDLIPPSYLESGSEIEPSYQVVRCESVVKDFPLQKIVYGAPGTGKSHGTKEITEKYDIIRTTFHPESDYSTFVGAYKPSMEKVLNEDGTLKEKRIVYNFIPQAFTKAYVAAWEKMLVSQGADTPVKPQFLVIEEINRGNCAQIFGDLFQLLDRGENGFSTYPISPDQDLAQYLQEAFEGLEDERYASILNGEVLLLPPNLYIWATMNTSDQSLFPMDSAFKRRWEWEYVPIVDHPMKKYKITLGNKQYDWWQFLEAINTKIQEVTGSEDKQLGYFFVRADNGKITPKMFVNKVFFYLWNTIFKDCYTEQDFLKKNDTEYLTFTEFFKNMNGSIEKLLTNLNVEEDIYVTSNTEQTTEQ